MEQLIRKINQGLSWEDCSAICPENTDIKQLYQEVQMFFQTKLQTAEASSHPVFIQISGLPASGKTILAKTLQKQYPQYVYIAFDEIMESLSAYQSCFVANPEKAFFDYEKIARIAGYRLLENAVQAKYSIIFEHSNACREHVALYEQIRQKGYFMDFFWIRATPQQVEPYLLERERFFPLTQVEERWRLMQILLPKYKAIADQFEVVNYMDGYLLAD